MGQPEYTLEARATPPARGVLLEGEPPTDISAGVLAIPVDMLTVWNRFGMENGTSTNNVAF